MIFFCIVRRIHMHKLRLGRMLYVKFCKGQICVLIFQGSKSIYNTKVLNFLTKSDQSFQSLLQNNFIVKGMIL